MVPTWFARRSRDASKFLFQVPLASMVASILPIGQIAAQGELQGRVLERLTGVPISRAVVQISGMSKDYTTDSLGKFRATAPPGDYLLIVVAIGFQPETTTIRLRDGEVLVSDHILARTAKAQSLEPVRVSGTAAAVAAKLVGFNDRRRLGAGHFIDRTALDKLTNQSLANILQRVPGARVSRGRSARAWLISTRATSTGKCAFCRDASEDVLDRADIAAGAGVACYLDVYVDGILIYDSTSKRTPLFNLNSISPSQIDAIEVYTSAAQIPAQYNRTSGGCGVLLIWTRA